MPDATPWNLRLRRAIAFWAVLSAVSGPLLSGYRFLASHGRLPGTPEKAGLLTIGVNACMITFGLIALGFGFSGFFYSLAVRDDRRWVNLLKGVGIALFAGVSFIPLTESPGDEMHRKQIGLMLCVALFCLATPLSRWIMQYAQIFAIGTAAAIVGFMLLNPAWMRAWWSSDGQYDYSLKPLSELGFYDWVAALMGAAIYVWAYGAFQQWRTQGKWLPEVKERIGWKPNDGAKK
jgi:hypothetical protein